MISCLLNPFYDSCLWNYEWRNPKCWWLFLEWTWLSVGDIGEGEIIKLAVKEPTPRWAEKEFYSMESLRCMKNYIIKTFLVEEILGMSLKSIDWSWTSRDEVYEVSKTRNSSLNFCSKLFQTIWRSILAFQWSIFYDCFL